MTADASLQSSKHKRKHTKKFNNSHKLYIRTEMYMKKPIIQTFLPIFVYIHNREGKTC